jgi:hypothetical protein
VRINPVRQHRDLLLGAFVLADVCERVHQVAQAADRHRESVDVHHQLSAAPRSQRELEILDLPVPLDQVDHALPILRIGPESELDRSLSHHIVVAEFEQSLVCSIHVVDATVGWVGDRDPDRD